MSKKDKFLISAQKNLRKGQLSKAISDFQAVVELDPKDIRNRQKLAELLGRCHRTADSLVEYSFIAKYYAENGFYLKAIAVYKQMQKLDPTQFELCLRMAELHAKQGLVGNAMGEYRRVVSHYEKQGMVPEAINILQRMQELDPQNINVRVKIAETFAKGGLKEKGWETLEELLESLREKQNHAARKKLYSLFSDQYAELEAFQIGYAQTLVDLGESAEAIVQLKQLLAKGIDPSLLNAFLSRAYRLAGQYEQELALRGTLLEADPGNLDQRAALVEVLMLKGDLHQALAELEAWKEVFASHDRLAELKGFYETLRDNISDEPQISLTLGSIYELTGEGEKLFDLMAQGDESPSEVDPDATLEASVFNEALNDIDLPLHSSQAAESSSIDPVAKAQTDEPTAFHEIDLAREVSETDGPEEEFDLDLGFVLELDEDQELGLTEALSAEPEQESVVEDEPCAAPQEPEEADLIDFDFSDLIQDSDLEGLQVSATDAPIQKKGSRPKGKSGIRVEEGQIEVDDTESHYNLGLAYKEMGLFDEAITEFDHAMKNPLREIASLILQGLCLQEKGDSDGAISVFEHGLSIERATGDERANMNYELGLLYLVREDWSHARSCFYEVREFDPSFRDLQQKLSECKD